MDKAQRQQMIYKLKATNEKNLAELEERQAIREVRQLTGKMPDADTLKKALP